jgi:hypothetical protein
MKKMYLMLAAVAFVSVALPTEAAAKNSKALAGIAVIKSNATYKLIYKSELRSDVKVEIYDSRNAVVYYEVIKMSDGFTRPYNFANLPEGDYKIRVDNGSNWLTETVSHKAGKVEKTAHLTALNDGRYLLSVPGAGAQTIDVRIYNEAGKVLHHSKQDTQGGLAAVYNLNEIKGAVLFEITDSTGLTKTISR